MYSLIVVDDEKIMRTALTSFISENFCDDFCIAAAYSSGQDALGHMSDHPVDVVITDIRMAHMSGLELARQISARWPACCLVVISGYNEFEYAKEAMGYGVLNYILKPIDFDEFSDCLMHVKQRLDKRHVASLTNIDLTLENVELFFTHILTGALKSPEEIQQRFDDFQLPFTLYDHGGQLLEILIQDHAPQWLYGREALSTALSNSLQMERTGAQVFPIFKKGWHFFFLLIGNSEFVRSDFHKIADTIRSILRIQCTLHEICRFKNILELVRNSELQNTFTIPKVPNPSCSSGALTTTEEDILIQKAKKYMDLHYASDLTRDEVAEAVFLSPSYLSRMFKLSTGISFTDYLTKVRMEKSLALIRSGIKVNEIAERVGYRSRNTFLVNFRHYTSYTPTEYRKHILKMEEPLDESQPTTQSQKSF